MLVEMQADQTRMEAERQRNREEIKGMMAEMNAKRDAYQAKAEKQLEMLA
jgi:Skp family chaperone for outer membrane proteins